MHSEGTDTTCNFDKQELEDIKCTIEDLIRMGNFGLSYLREDNFKYIKELKKKQRDYAPTKITNTNDLIITWNIANTLPNGAVWYTNTRT